MGCFSSKAPTAPKPAEKALWNEPKADEAAVKPKELVSATGRAQETAAGSPVREPSGAATPAPAAQPSEEATLAPARFAVGQQVECRDPLSFSQGLAAWKPGTVTCADPLRVTREGHHCFAYEWGEVRPLQERFAVGQRVECRDPSSCSAGLASWKLGTVTCAAPLRVTRDGHHAFAYEWSEVRLWQGPAADDCGTREVFPEPGISSLAETEASTGAGKTGIGLSCFKFCCATEAETEIVVAHDAAGGKTSLGAPSDLMEDTPICEMNDGA